MSSIQSTISRVKRFETLGGRLGEGSPAPRSLVEEAVTFLEFAGRNGIDKVHASYGADGEIQLTFGGVENGVEITLELDGSITLAVDSHNRQLVFEENASRALAYDWLRQLTNMLCDSSELSTRDTTILTGNDLIAWLSKNQAATEGSLLLIAPVAMELQDRSACTFVSTMRTFLAPQFTGKSPTTRYQPTADLFRVEVPLETIAISTSTIGRQATLERPS